ncbi:MAG: radical SAM protein [Sulfuricella sp.]|nr:radical SAM protein [Sulfuricella sp.]
MLRNLYLVISQDCNLACGYCYAQGGDFGRGASLMKPETMRAAFDRLLPLAGKTLAVSFFGGEPLLNFELMKDAVAYGQQLAARRDVRFVYCLTTNGTLLDDERLAFLAAHVRHIAISLDGGAAVTNAGRRFKDGGGDVHGTVLANIRRLRKAGIPFALRGTVMEQHAAGLEEAARHLDGLGAVSLRIAPAAAATEWRGDSLRAWTAGYGRLNRASLESIMAGREPVVANELCKVAAHRLLGERRLYPCAAGEGVLAVAADGGVYPCDHFVGTDAFCMGSVHDRDFPGEALRDVAARLKGNTVERRPKCAGCNVRYDCGGECPAQSLLRCGDIAEPSASHCAFTRKIARETASLLEHALADEAGKARLTAFLGGG